MGNEEKDFRKKGKIFPLSSRASSALAQNRTQDIGVQTLVYRCQHTDIGVQMLVHRRRCTDDGIQVSTYRRW